MPVLHDAKKRAKDANSSRRRENNHGVGTIESNVVRIAVVPLEDPPLGRGEFTLDDSPLVTGRFNPTRAPVVLIEMKDGQVGDIAQFSSEGRFSRAAGSDHRDALHTPNVLSTTSGATW